MTINIGPHSLQLSSISKASYLIKIVAISVDIIVKAERFIRTTYSSYIYLLNNFDIDIKAERFIRTFHPSYIHIIEGINGQAPSGDHQQTLKSHHGASSMNTSLEHITYVLNIKVKQLNLDIKISYIYLTIYSVKMVLSNCLIINLDIYNYILVHQQAPCRCCIIVECSSQSRQS